MKAIRVPLAIRSFGAVLAISALQFSLAVLPCARAQGNFFTSVNLQSDIPGIAERTSHFLWLTLNGQGVQFASSLAIFG
jgi:hypothetical protein